MPPSSTDNISHALSAWAAQFCAEQLSDAVHEEAIRCIIDTVGVSVAGVAHPDARLSRILAQQTYGSGPCRMLGDSATWSAPAAAFSNGVAAHVLDFDDVSYEGMVHASAVVWPAVLAAGELANASGDQVLTAFVCAVEAEYALGRAMTHDLFWRGWWTSGLLGSIGAAIGAAKVLGLDRAAMREAINIAACQATGPYVLVGSPVKPYACGRAAEAGVQAALAARCGLKGPAQAFEHVNGFIAMYGNHQFVPEELARLGTRFVLETSRVTFKAYPVCSAGQSSIEALQTIISANTLSGKDIISVRAEVTSDVAHYMGVKRASNITEAQFCLPFCLACILHFNELTPTHLTSEVIADPAVARAARSVKIIYSGELDELCAQNDEYQMSARVVVRTADGRTLTQLVRAPAGLPLNPMSTAQIEQKFLACAKTQASSAHASQELLGRITGLANLATSRGLYI